MSRLSHLVTALYVVLPVFGVAAQAAPVNQPPAIAPEKSPTPAKPAPKVPPSAAAPASLAATSPAAAAPTTPAVVTPPSTTPGAAPASGVQAAQPTLPSAEASPAPTPAPLGTGEQPGGSVYGADAPPAQADPYEPSLPDWAHAQCPQGRCGPDCRQRCGGNEFCSEYNTCEAIPEQVGQEHKGLLLRVTSGYGFGSLSVSDAGVREGSLVVGVGLDAGGTVIENLIIRGRLRGAVSYYRENTFGTNTLFSFGTAGVGIDYYFMPINIYLGGTLSVAGISRADEDNVNRSKAGLGLDFDAGKEWWISRHWGIGIALRATYIDVAPANILRATQVSEKDARLRSLHVGLQFSATFN